MTRLYGVPLLLAALILAGLLSALLGEGLWKAGSWIGLAVPLLVIAACLLRPTRGGRR